MRRSSSLLLLLIGSICLALFIVAPRADAQTSLPSPPIGDALVPPPPPPALAADAEALRGLSQYMAGHVAVRVVLPESTGAGDPSVEDWTPAQIDQIRREVEAGLTWWAEQLPLAQLRFSIRLEVVPTSYEPINYGLRDEGLWIADTLGQLGFRNGSHFDRAYAAGYSLRDELGADWATTIFIVNSARHPTGYFSDGYFAYAYIGGPLMVLTSDVGAYGADRMAPIAAHELGHIFGALDQYAAARVPCSERSGYLSMPTTNSQYGNCGTALSSIMLEPIGAFSNRQIDPSALAQVGYYDGNGDGVIDPLATTPSLELVDQIGVTNVQRPILSGTAHELGYPVPLQTPASIHTLSAIEYRVNGGAWQRIPAADGVYDSRSEGFAAELALYDGDHLVELRAINSAGRASPPAVRRVIVSGVGPAPEYVATAPAFVVQPVVGVQLQAPAGTSGVQISADPLFSAAVWQPFAGDQTLALPQVDGTYTFYVRFRDAAGRPSLTYPLPILLDTTPPEGEAIIDLSQHRLLLNVADSGSGVAAVEVRAAGHEPIWLEYQPDIQLPELAFPVQIRFRDAVGNLSPPHEAPVMHFVRLPLVSR